VVVEAGFRLLPDQAVFASWSKENPGDPFRHTKTTILTLKGYACLYWLVHSKLADTGSSDPFLQDLIRRLLCPVDRANASFTTWPSSVSDFKASIIQKEWVFHLRESMSEVPNPTLIATVFGS
jgi:hypothetical protein